MSIATALARLLDFNLSLCPSFHTPYGAFGASFSPTRQLGRLDAGKQLTHIDCRSLPLAGSGSSFALAHAVRFADIPDTPRKTKELSENLGLEAWLAGSFAFSQGWWALHRNASLFVMLGGGSCGAWCAIAAAVALVVEHAFPSELSDQLAVLDVGAGVSTFSACLSSNHGFQTMAMVLRA